MFHLPSMALAANVVNPFNGVDIVERPFLPPTAEAHSVVVANIATLSEAVWVDLGSRVAPEVPTNPNGGLTPDALKAAFDPLTNKDKKCPVADRTAAKHKLLLASGPIDGSTC